MTRVALDIYGLRVAIDGDWPEVIKNAGLDFAWFERPPDGSAPHVHVRLERRAPEFDAFGEIAASFVTPRNVVYHDHARTLVDYFGRALTIFDRHERRARIQGYDEGVVHEATYQFVVSAVGLHLDAIGLPRLHALGLVGHQGAVALMLPSGGGKTTLALRALESDAVTLLSEDSPLLDRQGMLHPFPLRIGVNVADAHLLPGGNGRVMERIEFQPKLALEVEAFVDRIHPGPAQLRHLVIGRRAFGATARLELAPHRTALGPLFRELVIGLGVYQGMEFVLQRGMRDVLRKGRPALTRFACAVAAVRGTQVWQFTTSRDRERNWDVLQKVL